MWRTVRTGLRVLTAVLLVSVWLRIGGRVREKHSSSDRGSQLSQYLANVTSLVRPPVRGPFEKAPRRPRIVANPILLANNRRLLLPRGGCFRGPTPLDWARPRHALRRPAVCTLQTQREEPWREWIYSNERTRSRLFVFLQDVRRELYGLGVVPPERSLRSTVRLFHSKEYGGSFEERRFFQKMSVEETQRAIAETLFSHPLRELLIHRRAEESKPFEGLFVASNATSDPQAFLAEACSKFINAESNAASLAYNIATLLLLGEPPSLANDCSKVDFYLAEAERGDIIAEARFVRLALERPNDKESDKLAQWAQEVDRWTWTLDHPVGHVMLAKHFWKQDCDKSAFHLMRAFQQVHGFIFDDAFGLNASRRARMANWYNEGRTHNEWVTLMNSQSHAAVYSDFHERKELLLHLAGEDAFAHAELGDLLLNGNPELGIQPDMDRAINHYQAAMDNGVGLGAVRLGLLAMEGVNVHRQENAQQLLEMGLNMGEPVGALGLGIMWLDGKGGVQANLTEALRMFEIAGAYGLHDAYYRAGLIYHFHLHNATMAELNYRKAIEKGHAFAAHEFGKLLLFSESRSCSEAVRFLRAAVRTDWTRYSQFDYDKMLGRFLQRSSNSRLEHVLNGLRVAYEAFWQPEAGLAMAFLLESGLAAGPIPSSVVMKPGTTWLLPPPSFFKWFGFSVPVFARDDTRALASEARRIYEEMLALEQDPSVVSEAARRLGDCFAQGWPGACDTADETTAQALYERAIHAGGDTGEAAFNLAWTLAMRGRKADALTLLDEAGKLMDGPGEVALQLLRFYILFSFM